MITIAQAHITAMSALNSVELGVVGEIAGIDVVAINGDYAEHADNSRCCEIRLLQHSTCLKGSIILVLLIIIGNLCSLSTKHLDGVLV